MRRLRTGAARERGSAYLITLLALVVLTGLALSISLVTQTEMQIGSNEMIVSRVFYAADSGIAAASARYLVDGACNPFGITLAESSGGAQAFQNAVDVDAFVPGDHAPCSLCQVNGGQQEFAALTFLTFTTATRQGLVADAPTVDQAVERLSVMMRFQPWFSGDAFNQCAWEYFRDGGFLHGGSGDGG